MNPVAISIFGLDVMWYGIVICSGTMLALLLSQYTCKLKGINYDDVLTIFLIAFPISIIGARLYYVLFEFGYYKDNLMDIFNIRQGGLAIHGGLIAAVIVVYICTKRKGIKLSPALDMAAPCIILAQAIGRWGNFFNQEAHGGPVTEAFISKFPGFIQSGMNINGTYYHPTFLYESIWNLVVFFILFYMLHKVKKNGVVFLTYIGLYSIGRFFIEGLRTDSLMMFGLRTAQIVSIIGVLIWIVGLIIIYRKKNSTITHI
ncbi:prolipoprotein diacylglyceryl transferase [Clostridium sp. UBA7503]|uniref:prolipoprotein diacylglyceryl transferase n=1 Tax=Clostridium sp. UBA7503 TaxID=1946377 RepID=UPI0032178829